MKVHESEKEKNTDIGDIKEYKKKQRSKKNLKFLIFVIILAVVIGVVIVNRDAIFEPLRGIFSKVTTTTDDEAGFPVKMPSSTGYSFDRLSDGFSLMTDTYLCTYDQEGTQIFAFQHGYVNPVCDYNNNSVLIYDKGGHSLALYSKTSEIYKQSTENEIIVTAAIGYGGYTAAVTSGGQYPNAVYVYDGYGKKVYTRRYIDEKVMQAVISPDNRYLYVSLIKSVDGDIITDIVKHEINGEEVWSKEISDSLSFDISVSDNSVVVVTDEKICYLSTEDGSYLSDAYEYKGVLKDYDIARTHRGVFLFDSPDKSELIVVMDGNGSIMATQVQEQKIKDVTLGDNEILLLTEDNVRVYDNEMNELSVSELDKGYIQIEQHGDGVLLMGGNTIDYQKVK
ncbi:MAG: hypothetical protein IJZ51_03060 [Ruminiclostridium sp.]|nr:hypothetical protein [Ruminiclostridium sp.]